MKILLVSTFPTHPSSAGNRAWILGQSETLKKLGHEVFFLFVLHKGFGAVSKETITKTKKYWGDHYLEYTPSSMDYLRIKLLSLKARFNKGYISCDDKYPNSLSNFVQILNKKLNFDLCVVNYFFLTKLFDDVKFPKTAVSTHDCFSYRDIRTNDLGTMSLTANEEAKAMQRCMYIFALQEEEKIYFEHLSPRSKVLNVYGSFKHHPSPIIGNKNIVILASGINYNINGINWFVREVLPEVRRIHPDAKLIVGGSVCRYLSDLENNPGVKLLGFVNSPLDLYSMGDIAINPVSQGTGLKIKTFESIAYDKVTIVHPHSLSGIYTPDRAPLFVGKTSKEWIEIILNFFGNMSKCSLIKEANKEYLNQMEAFIYSQYKTIEE